MPGPPHPDAPPARTFIFDDPGGQRWRLLRAAALTVLAIMGLILAGLGVSVALRPELPVLASLRTAPLPEQRSLLQRLRPAGDLAAAAVQMSARPPAAPALPGVHAAAGVPEVTGFYVNWDDNSLSSLKQHLGHLTELDAEWLHYTSEGLTPDNSVKTAALLGYLQAQRETALRVVPLVNNYDNRTQQWNSVALSAMLRSPARRASLQRGLLTYVRQVHGGGLMIDFEQIPDADQALFVTFMQELHVQTRELGLRLNVALPLDDDSYAYAALGQASDRVHLMAYDQHDGGGVPGPVAAQGWLQGALQTRLASLNATQVVLDIGNYGYDWSAGQPQADTVSFQDALTLAREFKVKPTLDRASLNPTFSYRDARQRPHTVWYLDAVSAFDSVQAALRLGVNQVALWRLGTEDPQVWKVLDRAALGSPGGLTAAVASSLRTLPYGYDLSYKGAGELLRVVSEPRDGLRAIDYAGTRGLILGERVQIPASPFVIGRWGKADPKAVALTFDDGPDPAWTPQLLKILNAGHIPATFFVIGLNVQQHPDLLRQIVAGGHEIGSHSFTHPNLSLVSSTQVELELGATQRLIQSVLGRGTLLFRPPFAEDVEPATPEQARTLQQASDLGYTTVGMGVDPEDWAKPGAARIAQSVLAQVQAASGQVVLLHDSGGDRSQTVAALPRIISELRGRGYHFVTVSQLVGLQRDQVMPKVGGVGAWLTRAGGWGFRLVSALGAVVAGLFVLGIGLSCLRLAVISGLGLLEALGRRRLALPHTLLPVTALVPAYNEAKVIGKTIGSLLTQGAGVRVIVIDDGSTDTTTEVVRSLYGAHPQVELYSVPNGGKARALNHGLRLTQTEVVVVIDADTVVSPGALAYLAAHFADPLVAAVAGNAKVGNRVNLLTRWQALEYITSQNVERRAMALLNCVSVVPGAIGAWRRGVLLSLGGFATDTLAEDADLTLRVLAAGWRVTYEQRATALTEAPDTVRDFLKQRFRWMYGVLQATWKQRGLGRRGAPRRLGLVTVPNVLVFQVALPLISALLDTTMLLNLAWSSLQVRYHPDSPGMNSQVLVFYLLFIGIDLFAAVLAFALEPGERWSLLLWLPLQRFFYRQMLYLVAIRAVLAALRGVAVGWGKLERRGSVQLPRIRTDGSGDAAD